MRHLPPRLLAAVTGTAYPGVFSKPHAFSISAFRCGEHHVGVRPPLSVGDTFFQRLGYATTPKSVNSKETAVQSGSRTKRNWNGEVIIYNRRGTPPGYIFVPSDNNFLTSRCRGLARESAQDILAVHRRLNRKKVATEIGLYVPEAIAQVAESEFRAKRAAVREALEADLIKEYPNIPPADHENLCWHILAKNPYAVGRLSLERNDLEIRAYVGREYTPYRTDLYANELEEVLASWREKGSSVKAPWRSEYG